MTYHVDRKGVVIFMAGLADVLVAAGSERLAIIAGLGVLGLACMALVVRVLNKANP